MASGSYNHVRRDIMPPTSDSSSALYKTNMNRTKTRKWVEAKVQSYDGDDWGNDDDDYDDGNDQHDAPEQDAVPEPLSPSRPTGSRQLGQTGYQLPSSRTFPSNVAPRVFNPPSLRGPDSRGPLRHAHTQPIVALPISAPIAEVGDGMNGFNPGERQQQQPVLHEAIVHAPGASIPLFEAINDEAKADIVQSRRFSTSPQLPGFKRVSGFGDDFFSRSRHHPNTNLASPLGAPHMLNEIHTTAATEDRAGNRHPIASQESAAVGNSEVTVVAPTSPQLPGSWVPEDPAGLVLPNQNMSFAKQDGGNPTSVTGMHDTSVFPATQNYPEPMSKQTAKKKEIVQLSIRTSEDMSNENGANKDAGQRGWVAGQPNDAILLASDDPTFKKHHQTPQTDPPETINSFGQPISGSASTVSSTTRSQSPLMQASSRSHSPAGTTIVSEIAPLNPCRVEAGHPDYYIPLIHQRQFTDSTIGTGSPQKESDKLREEIMKSLSPAPISAGLPIPGTTFTESNTYNADRDSTYLAGVYDDYLSSSPADEKTIRDRREKAKPPTDMSANHSFEAAQEPVSESQNKSIQPLSSSALQSSALETTTRPRRFSWEEGPEEVNLNPVELPASSPGVVDAESPSKRNTVSQFSDSLFAEAGWTDTISDQLAQVGSCAPGGSSTVAELASPISLTGARQFGTMSDELHLSHASIADEKERVLIGDVQSATMNTSSQHPALSITPEPDTRDSSSSTIQAPGYSPSQTPPSPTPFREILNFGTVEERIRKFDETREQFYGMDSGLSDWLVRLQSQMDHDDNDMTSNASEINSLAGTQVAFAGSNAAQPPHKVSGASALHQRRKSIGHMQHLLTGQSSALGASGNQMGTKSKELLHAAGAFGNKGVKSGMKLFNKGKSKLRERAGGDKAFF